MNQNEIQARIRHVAKNTDTLIAKLDTLTNRIDTARVNENQELVEYYENQFAEASVEFMDGVETILDDWYALRGEARPAPEQETFSPEQLDEIHDTVVRIVTGVPLLPMGEEGREQRTPIAVESRVSRTTGEESPVVRPAIKKSTGRKVDLTG